MRVAERGQGHAAGTTPAATTWGIAGAGQELRHHGEKGAARTTGDGGVKAQEPQHHECRREMKQAGQRRKEG